MRQRRVGALVVGATGLASFLILATLLYALGVLFDANSLDPEGGLIGMMVLAVLSLVVGLAGVVTWAASGLGRS